MNKLSPLLAVCVLALATTGHAQSSCSSDGQARPAALLERFISADCDSCWSDTATPVATGRTLALDWVLPGTRGEDAPLSAVAGRDALDRLQSLGRKPVLRTDTVSTRVAPANGRLRVAHGLPFNDYVGASIELRAARGGPWTAWLVLVETLPAGTEGSPVERNLVRNALRVEWKGGSTGRLLESRPMGIPQGTKPSRLRVAGWVEDARGRVVAAAQSRCGTS